jgi:hypothetical protein
MDGLSEQIGHVPRQIVRPKRTVNWKNSAPVYTEEAPDVVLALHKLELHLQHYIFGFSHGEMHRNYSAY